jgi:hypothetical protein
MATVRSPQTLFTLPGRLSNGTQLAALTRLSHSGTR